MLNPCSWTGILVQLGGAHESYRAAVVQVRPRTEPQAAVRQRLSGSMDSVCVRCDLRRVYRVHDRCLSYITHKKAPNAKRHC